QPHVLSLTLPPPPPVPAFPYTTLFRSTWWSSTTRPTLIPDGHQAGAGHARPDSQEGGRSAAVLDSDSPDAPAATCRDPESISLEDRKSTRLNSSHVKISYAVFCLKKKN